MKCCRICGVSKPLTDFGCTKKSKDGRDTMCKSCKNVRSRQHYNLNSNRIKEHQRAYLADNKETKYASSAAYRNNFPNKIRAHRMVNDALRGGKISKQPCECCGDLSAIAHHDDYLKPMVVRWLCRKHHAEWHRDNGEALNGK
ncbi:baseplate wedge protein [Yersinia phage PYps23T]|uniref:Baseplate wedge protein n=2 Tax=Carltongylesvirus TaxID=2732960 RepID=A0AAE7PDC3_9CAUD|nr:baseplate wedge protein [Yersinia phage PYps23T]YP_010844706.1 baseplate wedge protein [Yersinia phage PYps16N]QQO90963.1 baseplate wedge protein [Yersinia phage PYps23T]QQO91218.1 baseplate wedge protein [Yersinia phage PYps16N]